MSSSILLSAKCETLVPCYYVLRDSLLDNGNNDRNTVAKANYLPYGIDFPGGPTGRFGNGRNAADFIAELLGFTDHIPPFTSARGDTILNGVNYASGGAGILSATGKQFGDVICLDEQLWNHQITINRIRAILGNAAAAEHLRKCIYLVGMGNNDCAAYATGTIPSTPELFADMLISQYSRQLSAVFLVDVLNNALVGSSFIYVNTFGITVSDPSFKGFKSRKRPCCTVSGMGMCLFQGITCGNRSDFEYFDGYHPTEAAAMAVARRAFSAQSPSDAYPTDIQLLAQAQ